MPAGEGKRRRGELLRQRVRKQAQHRERRRGQHEREHGERRPPAGGAVRVHRGLLPEDGDVDFQQIRGREPAREEKQPLHRRDAPAAGFGGKLHNALVQEGLAEIAAKARNARERPRAAEKHRVQQGLAAPEAADGVEVERVGVCVDDAREEEERELHERVVQHVKNRPVRGESIVLAEQGDHGHAQQDKADLRERGAGEDVLEVVREYRKHRAEHHRHRAERKDQEPPARVAGEHLRREQEHAEDASLCQHA